MFDRRVFLGAFTASLFAGLTATPAALAGVLLPPERQLTWQDHCNLPTLQIYFTARRDTFASRATLGAASMGSI